MVEGGGSRGSVLLADDDRDFAAATGDIVERAGCGVSRACNGKQAVERVRKNGFDVLIPDIDVPVLSELHASRRPLYGGVD